MDMVVFIGVVHGWQWKCFKIEEIEKLKNKKFTSLKIKNLKQKRWRRERKRERRIKGLGGNKRCETVRWWARDDEIVKVCDSGKKQAKFKTLFERFWGLEESRWKARKGNHRVNKVRGFRFNDKNEEIKMRNGERERERVS